MRVPLTVGDFLDRAAFVYGERAAVVDEPDAAGVARARSPTPSSAARRAAHGRSRSTAWASGDGERVAIVSRQRGPVRSSPFFGVSGYGRVLVPDQLPAQRRRGRATSSSTRARRCCWSTPSSTRRSAGVTAKHRIVLDGARRRRAVRRGADGASRSRGSPTRTPPPRINYTSRHHRPAQGRAAHPPQLLAQRRRPSAGTPASPTATSTCTRCRCSTATAGACRTRVTGMGVHAGRAAQDRRRGDPAPHRARTASRCCAARRPWSRRSSTPRRRGASGRADPGPRPGAHRRGRRAAAVEDHRAGRDRAGLGVHPDLRAHRDVAAAHHQPRAAPSGTTSTPAERARLLARAGAPPSACSIDVDDEGEVLARSNHVFDGYWEQPEATAQGHRRRLVPHRRRRPPRRRATSSISDRKKDVIITGGENVSSIEVEDCLYQHPAVAEVAVIGVPDEKWGETVKALVVLRAGRDGDRGRAHRALPRPAGPLQVPDLGRVPRRAGPHRHRQAPEVQAPRAVLGGPRPPGELIARPRAAIDGRAVARGLAPGDRSPARSWPCSAPSRAARRSCPTPRTSRSRPTAVSLCDRPHGQACHRLRDRDGPTAA